MYHFETLPVRPGPQPLESLSSYLVRVANANGIHAAYPFFQMIFPGRKRNVSGISDLPLDLVALPNVLACREEVLLGTTLYYLLRRFDCPLDTGSTTTFLEGSLGAHLRYCPVCVAEEGYYKLPWRFSMLHGCPQHHCYLLDRCTSCGQPIPLLTTPLQIGHCPTCRHPLAQSLTSPLSPADLQIAQVRFYDLACLLLPCAISPSAVSVQSRLLSLRQQQGLSRAQMAHRLSTIPPIIRRIEGESPSRQAPFQTYGHYADILSVLLSDLFSDPHSETRASLPVQQVLLTSRTLLDQHAEQVENDLLQQVQAIIERLRAAGEMVTVMRVSQLMKMNSSNLKCHPRIATLLNEWHVRQQHEWLHKRETQLIAAALELGQQWATQDTPLTQRIFTQRLGLTASMLCLYPQLRQVVNRIIAHHAHQRELYFVQSVRTTIQYFRKARIPLTLRALANAGISLSTLRRMRRDGKLNFTVSHSSTRSASTVRFLSS